MGERSLMPAPRRTPPRTTRVRPFVDDDFAGVFDLRRRVYGDREGAGTDEDARSLRELFCANPWRDEALPSLICEGGDGRIVGCLGVLPRPMSLGGRRIRAAVSHSFMVDPGARTTPAAVELVRALLAGRQDLTLADGNSRSEKLWTGLGGQTSLLYSIRWTRPLRPARYALGFLGRRGLRPGWQRALRPCAVLADAALTRVAGLGFEPPAPRASARELADDELLACLKGTAGRRALRAEYDRRSLRWLLGRLERKRDRGGFRKVLVCDAERAVGWYLAYLNPEGQSEVVQAGALGPMAEVVAQLYWEAWRCGSVAVSGQLDPPSVRAYSDGRCLFHDGGGSWTLVHARDSDVAGAIHRGDAFLSRLESEWWIAA